MSSEEGPTWNEKEEFFQNSSKSISFHELSKINEIKKKQKKTKKKLFFIRIRI